MATNEDIYICPKCSSDNIVKLSLIYKHGISSSSSTGTISKGAFNSIDVNLDSESQTMGSESATPPTGPVMNFFVNLFISFVLLIVGLLVFYIIFFTVPRSNPLTNEQIIKMLILMAMYLLYVLFIIVKLIINSYLYARKYPSAMHRWRNSYQCQRCDSEFVLME